MITLRSRYSGRIAVANFTSRVASDHTAPLQSSGISRQWAARLRCSTRYWPGTPLQIPVADPETAGWLPVERAVTLRSDWPAGHQQTSVEKEGDLSSFWGDRLERLPAAVKTSTNSPAICVRRISRGWPKVRHPLRSDHNTPLPHRSCRLPASSDVRWWRSAVATRVTLLDAM